MELKNFLFKFVPEMLIFHFSANDTVGFDYYANTFRLPPYHIDVAT